VLTPEENNLLCRVEGDAPMGQLMRRHWMPACLVEEVGERDGPPVRVRMLGEDLVAFRDTDGRVGVIDEHCPHRRASLFFGRNEACGLRCLYHGWKMDVDGNVLEMASEPPSDRVRPRIRHTAYPTREAGGFVWVYMGPAAEMPPFEPPAFAPTPETNVSIVKIQVDCNWAQILEGAIDSAHSSTLHSTDIPAANTDRTTATGTVWARPTDDKSPRIHVQRTTYGMRYAAIRRPIRNPDSDDYVRITTFVAPITVLIPPNNVYGLANVNVPMDDTHTAFYFIAWSDWGPGVDTESWRAFCAARVGVDLDAQFRRTRTRANDYRQDREAMRRGDHTGIAGIPNQDIAMWETMGPIADRSREHLGASDIAIVQFRRIMVDAVKRFARGEPAIGTAGPRIPHARLRAYEGIVPKSTDWRTLGACAEEIALFAGPAARRPAGSAAQPAD
jgi:phthalate 4,5-dioxygenase oxygenase subunit